MSSPTTTASPSLRLPTAATTSCSRGRDNEFKRNPYAPYLRDKDFSKTEEASELEVCIYFSHDGWREAAGMEVVRSAWCGEWLLPEGAAVNGLLGCSQYEVGLAAKFKVSAERARFSPRSTGRYKSMMVGFRMVYDADVRK